MSLIKPTLDEFLQDDSNLDEDDSKQIDFVAAAASALNPPSVSSPSVPPTERANGLLGVLDDNGASLEAAARRIRKVIDFPDNDAVGLKAAEIILRANGLLKEKEKDKKEAPEVSITIIGSGNQSVINLLMPK